MFQSKQKLCKGLKKYALLNCLVWPYVALINVAFHVHEYLWPHYYYYGLELCVLECPSMDLYGLIFKNILLNVNRRRPKIRLLHKINKRAGPNKIMQDGSRTKIK